MIFGVEPPEKLPLLRVRVPFAHDRVRIEPWPSASLCGSYSSNAAFKEAEILDFVRLADGVQ